MYYNKFIQNFISQNLEGQAGKNTKFIDDPTTMGFNLWFDHSEASPFLNLSDRGESAKQYLTDCYGGEFVFNDNTRDVVTPLWHYNKFIEKLQYLVMYTPYYFQKLSGLGEIYKFDPKVAWNKIILAIDTLESIDLRIGGMAYHYINATYDTKNRKFILPVNLRYFSFVITLSEIRSLRTFTKELVKDSDFGVKQRDLNPLLDFWAFQFKNSEFDFSESNPAFDGVSNVKPEYITNKFKIMCGPMVDQSKIGYFNLDGDGVVAERASITDFGKSRISQFVKNFEDKAKQKAKEFAAAQLNNLQAAAREKFLDPLNNRITQAEFGNVFFRGTNQPNLPKVLLGEQSLQDLNPISGRVGDWSMEVAKINLAAGSGQPPQRAANVPEALTQIASENLGGGETSVTNRQDVIKAIMGNTLLANLGNLVK